MLSGKKTYIVVVGGIIAVVGGFLQGAIDITEAINQVLILLGIGGLRIGIGNNA